MPLTRYVNFENLAEILSAFDSEEPWCISEGGWIERQWYAQGSQFPTFKYEPNVPITLILKTPIKCSINFYIWYEH